MYKSYLENSNFSTYSEEKLSFKSKCNKKAQSLLLNKIFVPAVEVCCAVSLFFISLMVVLK